MKKLDVLAAALLVLGGLNWGLWGLFKLDLVAAVSGPGSMLSSFGYSLVGLAALYQATCLRSIQRRWRVVTASA
jgi:hypothetical protein